MIKKYDNVMGHPDGYVVGQTEQTSHLPLVGVAQTDEKDGKVMVFIIQIQKSFSLICGE